MNANKTTKINFSTKHDPNLDNINDLKTNQYKVPLGKDITGKEHVNNVCNNIST